MRHTDELTAMTEVYAAGEEVDRLFGHAMIELYEHHYNRCKAYRAYCDHLMATPDLIKDWQDAGKIPPLFVNVFKYHQLRSIDDGEVALHLTSSGTTGQTSQVFFDKESLRRGLAMVDLVFTFHGLKNPDLEVNYIAFAHEPGKENKRGTSYTDDNLTRLTGRKEVVFALRYLPELGDFVFAVDDVLKAMRRFERSEYPIRFIGFPSFLYLTLEENRKRGGKPFSFGKRCHVITGGGWKVHRDKEIPKDDLLTMFADDLGMPKENIRDSFGMVEHGVPYLECSEHRLHVPVYARALIKDVETLKPVEDGKVGLLQLSTPFNTAMPTHVLLTSDYAVLEQGCPCGLETPYFTILGRAGTTKNKGCAISALETVTG